MKSLRLLLLLFGIASLGYYAYTLSNQLIYEAYQNWAFDQEIAGRTHVTFADYVRERTPLGFLAGGGRASAAIESRPASKPQMNQPLRPGEGAVLGRIEVARLNLAAMVREGVDTRVLSVAVGHVPSTALPGESGNFAIAAHRDTLFRALKDIRFGDLVTFATPNTTYTYKVFASKIVLPTDVSVLQPDGGGLIPRIQLVSSSNQPRKLLTMITCYPFYYVGSAPKRFIVEAELVGNRNEQHSELDQASDDVSPPAAPENRVAQHAKHRKSTLQAQSTKPRTTRGFSHAPDLRTASAIRAANPQAQKKPSFWHRVFRTS